MVVLELVLSKGVASSAGLLQLAAVGSSSAAVHLFGYTTALDALKTPEAFQWLFAKLASLADEMGDCYAEVGASAASAMLLLWFGVSQSCYSYSKSRYSKSCSHAVGESLDTLIISHSDISMLSHPEASPRVSSGSLQATGTPNERIKGKSKGKGKAPLPLPPAMSKGKAKGKSIQAATPSPFGRRLDWAEISADTLSGTVFQQLGEQEPCDFERLGHLFARSNRWSTAKLKPRRKRISLLSSARAQQVLIHLKKWQLTDDIVAGLVDLKFDCPSFTVERCEGLLAIAPTAQESKLLLGFKGSLADLAEADRLLIPLAQLQRPTAANRLRLALLSCEMQTIASEVRENVSTMAAAFVAVRESSFLRIVFHKIRCLGNMLNHGTRQVEDGPVHGFAMSALSKLKLCKATLDPRITLLHILVLEVAGENPEVAMVLASELSRILSAARIPLRELVERVAHLTRRADHSRACAAEIRDGTVDEHSEAVHTASGNLQSARNKLGIPPLVFKQASVSQTAPSTPPRSARRTPRGTPRGTPRQPRQSPRQLLSPRQSRPVMDDAAASLDTFAKHAAAEAAALEYELASVRGEAVPLLVFFAEPVKSSRPEEVEVKVQELFSTLHNFLDAFHTCCVQLFSSPDLGVLCSRGGCSETDTSPEKELRSYEEAAENNPKLITGHAGALKAKKRTKLISALN